MATIVNERYALSLYEVAREEDNIAGLLEQLTAVADIARQQPELLKMLQTPSIQLTDRREIVRSIFENKVDAYLLNFLLLLVDKGRIGGLLEMQQAYKQRYYDEQGICEVTAVTAIALDEALKEKLRLKTEKITGKQVILHTKVDPSLIGGVVLQLGNEQIDTSVKTRLSELAQKMTEIIA